MIFREGDTVNWFRIIVDLGTVGALSSQQIADAINVPKGTMLGWKCGAEPRHADGERLIALWCGHLHRERYEVPVVDCASYLR